MDILPRLRDMTRLQLQEAYSLEYAKWLSCLGETTIASSASELFLMRYADSIGAPIVRKALTPPGTTTDPAWAGALVTPKPFIDAFVAIARSASLLGRIPGLRNVPFGVTVPIQTGDAGFVWVRQGAPKPVSKLAFADDVTLFPTKCAAIVPLTRELIKLTVPGAEQSLRDTLIAGLTSFTDKSFLDPASTAIADTRPGSVTSGTTPVTSTGNLAADIQTLLAAFFAGRPTAQAPVLVTNAANAAAIGAMNAGGGVGLPVIVTGAALGNVIAMDPAGIFVADNGVAIDMSEHATIQMNDTPDHPAVPGTTVFTSLWQENLVGFRVERFVNWEAVTGAVKYLAPA